MKPPPPRLPASGCVTASANAVATAASTALPPCARTLAPASHEGAETQTTRPSFDGTPRSSAERIGAPLVAARMNARIAMGALIGPLEASDGTGIVASANKDEIVGRARVHSRSMHADLARA